MRQKLLLTFSILISSLKGCEDNKLFKDFCNPQVCRYDEALEICQKTCGNCNSERRTASDLV